MTDDPKSLLSQLALDVHEHDKRLDELFDRFESLLEVINANGKAAHARFDRLESDFAGRVEALEQRAGTTAARLGQLEDAVDDFTGGAYALDAARAERAKVEAVRNERGDVAVMRYAAEPPPTATRARRYTSDEVEAEINRRELDKRPDASRAADLRSSAAEEARQRAEYARVQSSAMSDLVHDYCAKPERVRDLLLEATGRAGKIAGLEQGARNRQARLEQLVERWRGAAERLRERDRTSQRFERDIAEAYETCADELFALLEQGGGR